MHCDDEHSRVAADTAVVHNAVAVAGIDSRTGCSLVEGMRVVVAVSHIVVVLAVHLTAIHIDSGVAAAATEAVDRVAEVRH